MSRPLRLLFLSDTHLGFDEPLRPRSRNPHRGPDFFAAFHRALEIARDEHVDAVIHGGDLFFRSRVPDALIDRAMAPIIELAEAGIPVFLIAGNHERSFLPRTLFTAHDLIHIFDEPRTVRLTIDGTRLAIGGFPCVRQRARESFPRLVAETGLLGERSDVRLLCIHQMVEGARVGPSGYMFRSGEDVVRASDLPRGLAAVLSGHVHRHQILRADLSGAPLSAPVVYAGSTERTSFAEVSETKGFVSILAGPADGQAGDGHAGDGNARDGHARDGHAGALRSIEFRSLPARPMYVRTLESGSLATALERFRSSLADMDPRGVLRVRIPADLVSDSARIIAAVKGIVPHTMFLSFGLPSAPERFSDSSRH
jgi:DNA repair protein SbcD/Mre11